MFPLFVFRNPNRFTGLVGSLKTKKCRTILLMRHRCYVYFDKASFLVESIRSFFSFFHSFLELFYGHIGFAGGYYSAQITFFHQFNQSIQATFFLALFTNFFFMNHRVNVFDERFRTFTNSFDFIINVFSQ